MQSLYKRLGTVVLTLAIAEIVQANVLPITAIALDKRYIRIACTADQFNRNDYENALTQMDNWLDTNWEVPSCGQHTEQSGSAQTYICNQGSNDQVVTSDYFNQMIQMVDNQCGQTNAGWASEHLKDDNVMSYGRNISGRPECSDKDC